MMRIILAEMLLGLMLLMLLPVTGLAEDVAGNHTLGIFGNANEDDVIDMRDVTCIERIILGFGPSRQLADAWHDGKVDMQDITQTELIIARREKVLTITDNDGEAVTVPKPVKRVISDHTTSLTAMRVLDAEDILVGIDTGAKKWMGPAFLKELAELPTIGGFSAPDYEAILSLKPDVYFVYRSVYSPGGKEALREKLPGVTLIETGYYTPYNPENLTTDMRKLGYILDKRDQAEAYIDWYNSYLDMIKERTAGISEYEKQRVYPAPGWDLYNCIANFRLADIAGGINIGAGLGPTYVTVDPEWVIKQNPDVILKQSFASKAYDTDDPSGLIAEREKILNRPELANVSAVKKKRVYLWHMYTSGMFPNDIITIVYVAKWLYPDLFDDLDPRAVHQEYLDRFTPLLFNVKQHGVFVYPPFEG
jgi:iron complex transport system substrate-binding protein